MSSENTKELFFACALANAKVRLALQSNITELKFQSRLAAAVVDFFSAKEREIRPYRPMELRTVLLNSSFIEEEALTVLKLCGEFGSQQDHETVETIVEGFTRFFQTRKLMEFWQEDRDNPEKLIANISALKESASASIPIHRVGELDIRKVVEEDLGGDLLALPSAFPCVRRASAVGGYLRGQIVLVVAATGVGKAQPLTSPIFTPTGIQTMGEMQIGTEVCTPNGSSARVQAIHPQGLIDVYQVCFSDGTKTECSLDHLWKTTTWNERRKGTSSVKTLKEIKETLHVGKKVQRKNHSIPQSQPLDFKTASELPLHPYVLGALLGDGSFRSITPSFTSCDEEILTRLASHLPSSVKLVENKGGKYGYYISGGIKKKKNALTTILQELGLWGHTSLTKFIPKSYLFSSVEERIDLLRGLCDTDGECWRSTNPIFATSSRQLAEDVRLLVETLGGIATIAYKEKTQSYRVTIRLNINPFYLPRKAEVWKPRTKYFPKRFITAIEYLGKKECQCITLDDTEHLYLTDHCLVTHNSLFMMNEAVETLRAGHTVVYFALGDLTRLDCIHRLCAIAQGVSLFDVSSGDNVYHYFNDEMRELSKNLIVSCVPPGYLNAYQLRACLENQIAQFEQVDHIIIDYDSNIKRGGGNTDSGVFMYLASEDVYNLAGTLAKPLNAPHRLIHIASQPKTEFMSVRHIPANGASESKRKPEIVDIMVTIGNDGAIPDRVCGIISIEKHRRGNTGEKDYYYRTDCGTFCVIDEEEYRMLAHGNAGGSSGSWSGNSRLQRQFLGSS